VPPTVEPKRRVRCPSCGGVRWLSSRNARSVENGEASGLCQTCRNPRAPATPEERDAVMRWWLDRYSDEELADLALGLGFEGACAEGVAAQRARLRNGSEGWVTA
jgi:hypothetical protein